MYNSLNLLKSIFCKIGLHKYKKEKSGMSDQYYKFTLYICTGCAIEKIREEIE